MYVRPAIDWPKFRTAMRYVYDIPPKRFTLSWYYIPRSHPAGVCGCPIAWLMRSKVYNKSGKEPLFRDVRAMAQKLVGCETYQVGGDLFGAVGDSKYDRIILARGVPAWDERRVFAHRLCMLADERRERCGNHWRRLAGLREQDAL